jgi:hypothetical protein
LFNSTTKPNTFEERAMTSTAGLLREKDQTVPLPRENTDGASAEDVQALRDAAAIVARAEVSDAVTAALNAYEGSLRDLRRESGLDPAFVSKLARGVVNKRGATVASLAQIALAMNKTLTITIE